MMHFNTTAMTRVASTVLVSAFLMSSMVSTVEAAPFGREQVLEVQYISLGSTYYAYVLAEHEAREQQIRRIRQSPDLALQEEFGPYLTPTLYNTVVFRLFPDGSATAEMVDPNNHTQSMIIAGTYVRQGRNLTIELDDDQLQIYTVFVGKSSKDDKKCYQGTSEAPQPGFPGSFWVTYWQGCR